MTTMRDAYRRTVVWIPGLRVALGTSAACGCEVPRSTENGISDMGWTARPSV